MHFSTNGVLRVMRSIGLVLLLLSFSQSAICSEQKLIWSAKESLSAEYVPFVFHFYGEGLSDSDKTITRIAVINSATQQPIQIIKDLSANNPEQQFALVDVNFDGVKDIRLGTSQPGFHYYWIYDRQSGQFQRELNLEKIPNAEFDKENKKIISLQHEPMGSRKTYYEYQNQQVVLVRQEIQNCDLNHHCETTSFVRASNDIQKIDKIDKTAPKSITQTKALTYAKQDLDYLYSLANRKAVCLANVSEVMLTEDHERIIKAQLQLSECYKKVILDLAQKFYSPAHFGQDLEGEINAVVEQHNRLLHKMAHCPASKVGGCRHYEQFDVLAGTVDYLNELIEFMVLNVGEGYAEFNPERWLKRWDAVLAKS